MERPDILRRFGVTPGHYGGLIADVALFLTNLVYLTPAAGWLESLVSRALGSDDPVAARQLGTLLTIVVVLQCAGAYLKRRPLQSRSPEDMGGLGWVLILGNYILSLMIMTSIVVFLGWSGDSPWPIFLVMVLAGVPTYLFYRALQPIRRPTKSALNAAPVEWIADACLLSYVIANTMFFNLLTGYKAQPPTSLEELFNHLLSLFVIVAIVFLWYLPPRQLFLADDFRDRGTWIRMLVAMAPIAFRWVAG